MSLLQAFVLGIVQGFTEFLPISSDGHLVLVPFVVGWPEPTLAFIVAVHIGTLIALVAFFADDVRALARTVLGWKDAQPAERRVVRLLAIGTVPAVIAGIAFRGVVESSIERPVLVAALLGLMGYVLLSTESKAERHEGPPRAEGDVGERDATVIGIAQATALLPGISRSGMTIAAGMRLGLSRPAAARFSFLLAIPVTFGAVLAQIPDILDEGLAGGAGPMLVGIVTSAASGFVAIRWLLALVQRRDLRPFGTYLMLAMVAGFLTALARG